MLICEECRVRHGWPKETNNSDGDCELCWDRNIMVRDIQIFNSRKKNFQEKMLDNLQQNAYRVSCEELAIYFVSGPQAGRIDQDKTDRLLNQITVSINGETDWVATYKRRLRAKQAYQFEEQRKRG